MLKLVDDGGSEVGEGEVGGSEVGGGEDGGSEGGGGEVGEGCARTSITIRPWHILYKVHPIITFM